VHSPIRRLRSFGPTAGLLVALGLFLLPPRAESLTVAGFGDSLTWAPGYLAQLPSEWETVNLSNGGECSWDGLLRLQRLLPTLDADVVVLMEGTNDVSNLNYTFARSMDSLTGMIDAVLDAGMLPVLMAPPPILPWDPNGPAEDPNGQLQALASALEGLADSKGIPFVNLLDTFAAFDDLDSYYHDGLHPNADGSGVIAAALVPVIRDAVPTPEPSTALLFGAGLMLLARARRQVSSRASSSDVRKRS
jgi:lysophospholipase L1-like esterase